MNNRPNHLNAYEIAGYVCCPFDGPKWKLLSHDHCKNNGQEVKAEPVKCPSAQFICFTVKAICFKNACEN